MRFGTRLLRVIAVLAIASFLFASCVTYVPMVEDEPVRVEKVFGGNTYYQSPDPVLPNTITSVLERYQETAPYAQQYDKRMVGNRIFSIAGAVMMLGAAGSSIGQAYGASLGLSLGAAIMYGISIPFATSAHRALGTGVGIYNDEILGAK